MTVDIREVIRDGLARAWWDCNGWVGTTDQHVDRLADAVVSAIGRADFGEAGSCTRAQLGLASTAEMLGELLARGEVEMTIRQGEPADLRVHAVKLHAAAQALLGSLPADMLAYRTVDPDRS